MGHDAMFARFFRAASWQPWRAFLAALFGLPMSEDQLATYRHHTGRTEPPAAPFTEAALICGRRGGKSRILATIATYLAAFREYAPHLAPGEVATIAVIAADRRQARTILRYVFGLFDAVPSLAAMVEDRTAEGLTLRNRVTIEVGTASFRATRGYTYAAVLCDEIAFWRSDEGSANPDAEILRAIRPGLSSIPGAMLLLASSPYAKRGSLYAAFRRHYGKDGAPVLVWRGTTAEMNPAVDPRVIAEAYEDDPVSAAAEFGAEFRSDIASFVSREVVDEAVVPGRREQLPLPGVRYCAFVDPAGGSGSDSFTMAIAHQVDDRAVLDAVREIRPPFSPEATVAELVVLLRAYGVREVSGDRYAGEWPREQFRKHGIGYRLSEAPKSDLYRDLLPLLNSGKLELLDLPRLTSQLCSLERRTARGGREAEAVQIERVRDVGLAGPRGACGRQAARRAAAAAAADGCPDGGAGDAPLAEAVRAAGDAVRGAGVGGRSQGVADGREGGAARRESSGRQPAGPARGVGGREMQQGRAERLIDFMQGRLAPDDQTEFHAKVEGATEARAKNGPDDPETAARMIDLLDFLNAKLPEDEVQRARKIIYRTDDNGEALAADAAMRVRVGLGAMRRARHDVGPLIGEDVVLACDSAGVAYRKGLAALGHDVSRLPARDAEGVFRAMRGRGAGDGGTLTADGIATLEKRLGFKMPQQF